METITFDQWSAIAASVTGRPRDALLDRLEAEGIELDVYQRSELEHLLAIADGQARGDRALAEAHGQRCARAKELAAGELDETVSVRSAQLPGAMPFAKPGKRVAPPPAREPVDQSGETVGLAPEFAPAASTPFEAAALAAWTVERYAAYVSDRRSGRAVVQLSEQEEAALLVHFNKRFSAEPGLRETWGKLLLERTKGPS